MASVFLVAICGLVYELVAGALSTYLVGDSVTHFSLVIGLFMFAMGGGSFLSRYVRRDPLAAFVKAQIAVGGVGGFSACLLLFAFTFLASYLPFLILISLAVGALVGLEIPLIIRVLRERHALAQALASVLALDYVGALVASILFPLILVPYLGLVRSAFLFGLLNVAVAGLALWRLREEIPRPRRLSVATAIVSILLLLGLVSAGGMTRFMEDALYQDEILLARDTRYQRVVITRWRDDIRLFLNGHIQFSSRDEARYHESLVHPVLAAVPGARRVLILGGGDGMAAREVLKYETVEGIDLVDLDAEVVRLFRDWPMLAALNAGALSDPRLKLHVADALKFLETTTDTWDAVIIDLPDPSSPALARLYSRAFYTLLGRHVAEHGAIVTQATSPFYGADAFWCIVATLSSVEHVTGGPTFDVSPYHVNVPSFGEWGFVLATRQVVDLDALPLGVPTRFLSAELLPSLFVFPKDIARRDVEINRLERPVLVRYYERSWREFHD